MIGRAWKRIVDAFSAWWHVLRGGTVIANATVTGHIVARSPAHIMNCHLHPVGDEYAITLDDDAGVR